MNHWPIFDEESVDVDYETEMVAEGWWRMAELGELLRSTSVFLLL